MIREFTDSDMDQVLSIWLDASVQAHDFVDRYFWESKLDDMRDLYIPGPETFVYDDEDTLKGFFPFMRINWQPFLSPRLSG